MSLISQPSPHRIGAIVVLYFPDLSLLERLLSGLQSEVDEIYVIDNTPKKLVDWLSYEWFLEKQFSVCYQSLGDNFGIAKAQNIGIELAMSSQCSHVILFDQDSAIPPNMIKELLVSEQLLLDRSVLLGSVGPLFLDEKTGDYAKAIRHGPLFINKIDISPLDTNPVRADYLIASGSLIRTHILQAAGLMREDLFIDWVDIEWGLRANSLGYSHFINPRAIMRHSIGDEFVSVGSRKINLHSDIRNYYIVRNAFHLMLDSKINRNWRLNIAFKIPLYVIFYTLTSNSKIHALKQLLRACLDGFSGKLGKAF